MRVALGLLVALLALSCSLGPASAKTEAQINRNALTAGITAMEKLPSGGFTAVEGEGFPGMAFISDNGRYVLRGDLYDTWTGKRVNNLADLRDNASRVQLSKLGVTPAELGAFRYGTGSKEVTIFVDPKCPYCHGILQQMPALAGKYTFQVIVVPVLGQESERLTRMVSCATDPAAALAALMAGPIRDSLPQNENCNLLPIQKRLVTAQLVGVKGVPFMIAPDGRTKGGLPQDLDSWLEGRI